MNETVLKIKFLCFSGIPPVTASTVTAAAVAAAEAGVSAATAASSGGHSVPQTPVTTDMPGGKFFVRFANFG